MSGRTVSIKPNPIASNGVRLFPPSCSPRHSARKKTELQEIVCLDIGVGHVSLRGGDPLAEFPGVEIGVEKVKVITDFAKPAVPVLVTFTVFVLNTRVKHELREVRLGDGAPSPQSFLELNEQAVVALPQRNRPIQKISLDGRGKMSNSTELF